MLFGRIGIPFGALTPVSAGRIGSPAAAATVLFCGGFSRFSWWWRLLSGDRGLRRSRGPKTPAGWTVSSGF